MRESVTTRVDAAPALVFARLVDIGRLPEWNRAITGVVEQPSKLTPGAVWKVRLHALGQSWVSRSTLIELDEAQGTFRYRSQTDDGNRSYADWEWTVQPDGDGAQVAVAVELHPLTFWRKYLLAHIRRPALRKEMHASLTALSATVSA
jgi:Polyketide cyclase / dehydrase and lipid transport